MLSKISKDIGSSQKNLIYLDRRRVVGEGLEQAKEISKTLREQEGSFFSVITYYKRNFSEETLENTQFFSIRRLKCASRLDQALSRKIWEQHNSLSNQVKEELEKKGIKESDDSYGKNLDRAFSRLRRAMESQVLEELVREEMYYRLLDSEVVTEDMDEDHIDSVIERRLRRQKTKDSIILELTSPVYESKYVPKFGKVFGPKIRYLFNDYFCPEQIFIFKNKNGQTSIIRTSYRGSGSREMKGLYAHAFRDMENNGVKIKTYVMVLKDDFSLDIASFNKLVIDGHDLTGNFSVSREQSQSFLTGAKIIYSEEDIKTWGR